MTTIVWSYGQTFTEGTYWSYGRLSIYKKYTVSGIQVTVMDAGTGADVIIVDRNFTITDSGSGIDSLLTDKSLISID